MESKCVIVDELVHSVLMQPNGIGIALDEFVDVYAIYCFGAPNSHLFPVDEYKHELLSSFLLRGLLGRGEPFLLFRHVMILVCKCHIKSRRSGVPRNPAGRHSWTSVLSRILKSPTSALEKIRSRSWTSAV